MLIQACNRHIRSLGEVEIESTLLVARDIAQKKADRGSKRQFVSNSQRTPLITEESVRTRFWEYDESPKLRYNPQVQVHGNVGEPPSADFRMGLWMEMPSWRAGACSISLVSH